MSGAGAFRNSVFARLLDAHPLVYVDIGAREDFEAELLPLAFCSEAIGFEPAPDEWRRLQDMAPGPWRSRRILPHAIAGKEGRQTLYIPQDPRGASLLRSAPEVCKPFGKSQFFEIVSEVEIDALPLSKALAKAGVGGPDYLKIDVEGAEYEILQAAEELLPGVCAAKIEVSFLPFRQGHPLAAEIEIYLREQGLQLFDLVGPAHWRIHGNIIHPFRETRPIPYSRGQITHGDYLFFRTVDTLDMRHESGRVQAFKTAVLAMNFGYFDYADQILADERMTELLAVFGINDVENAIGNISRAFGRDAFRQAFWRQFRGVATYLRRLTQVF